MGIHSDPSDSEESDDDDIQGTINAQQIELYNPKDFEDLKVSTEVKELFQNIMRYTFSSFPYLLNTIYSYNFYNFFHNFMYKDILIIFLIKIHNSFYS